MAHRASPDLLTTGERALARVMQDVPVTLLPPTGATVLEACSDGTVRPASGLLDALEWLDVDEESALLLRIGANVVRLDANGESALIAEIAGRIQDSIADADGRAWPVAGDGRVLDVIVDDGVAVWTDGRGGTTQVGQLGRGREHG
jgi:hypothetical protein